MGTTRDAARQLWDYHQLHQALPERADLLLVGGSHDLRVAEYAAELALSHDFRAIVVSGGAGKITGSVFKRPEAELFAEVMERNGVSKADILLETHARHSGENITLSRELLMKRGVTVSTGVLVTKPYMERRFWATAAKQWPEVDWVVVSPEISFDEYPSEDTPEQRMIELMVGDCQRVKIYGESGIQVPQEIPADVWSAFEYLASNGYGAQLIDTPRPT